MEAMFLEAPESMMKEEELENPGTKAWHLFLLSELEPPSFFLTHYVNGFLHAVTLWMPPFVTISAFCLLFLLLVFVLGRIQNPI